jgi:hypothetical protein
MGLKDVLLQDGPRLAMLAMAGAQGGMPGYGAALGGLQRGEFLRSQQQHQAQQDARAEEMQAAQLGNMQADNERQQQAQEMQKLQHALALIQQATQQQGETATDPAQAESAIKQTAMSAAGLYNLPPDALTGMVPNMSGPITGRKKKQAQEIYAQAEKTFGPEAIASDSITLQTGDLFGDVKPSQLRAMFSAPAIDAAGAPAMPVVPSKTRMPAAPGSFEEFIDASPERQAEIEGARKRYQQADDRPVDPALEEIRRLRAEQLRGTPGILPPNQQRRVDSKSRAFDSLPVTKTVQKMAEAVSFAQSLNPNTTNPADDQALIYAFAKAMDPDSVVREGEYATVQKYAQSWAQTFGFNAARMFSNTTFLTAQARQNMKATILSKFEAGRKQYDVVRKSYADQINKITGTDDGDSYLTDYGGAFPTAPGSAPAGGGGMPTYQEYLQRRQGGQ